MKTIIGLAFILIFSISASGQTTFSKVCIDLGYINNYQTTIANDKKLAFSPELKIGGKFLTPSFEWDLGISYWDDGIDEPRNIIDAASYSYSSTILSLRVNYYPPEVYIPFHFIAGMSARFVNEKYLGGVGLAGNFRNDNSFNLFTIDIGGGLEYTINDLFRVRCDALFIIPLEEKEILQDDGYGASLKLGLDYFLN